jgi:hypothetical protein
MGASIGQAHGMAKALGDAGRGKFVINLINLSELVEEMAHMLEISVSKKAVLRYDFFRNLPSIKADGKG